MFKLNKDSVIGTFVIITGFCLVCSVLVSSAVVALDPFKAAAVANDRQVSILRVAGVETKGTVAQTYQSHIEAQLLDLESGDILVDRQAEADGYNFASYASDPERSVAIPSDEDIAGIRRHSSLMPIYFAKNDDGEVTRVILPFYGAALWSTAYGYVALNPDGNTIEAVTFYSHGETPGLGGEIDNPRWQALWEGKKIEDENGKLAFTIVKNADHTGDRKDYEVDALSGATLTTNGIRHAAQYWLGHVYKPFLDKLRKGEIIQ